MKKVTILFS